jgi:hypothetical protein
MHSMTGHTKTLRMNQSERTDTAPSVLGSLKENFALRSAPTNKNHSHRRRSQARGRVRGRQPLSSITDSSFARPRARATNKEFYQPSQAPTAGPTQASTTQQTVFRGVLATDPAATAALWARVQGVMPPKKRVTENNQDNDRGGGGRGRGRGRGGRGGRGGQVDGGQQDRKKRKRNEPQEDESDELADVRLITPQSAVLTVEDTIQSTVTKVTVQSRQFKTLVLRPRRIVEENTDEAQKNPYSHFETIAPTRGDLLDYTAIKGLDAAEVWLSLSDDQVEQIIEEYQFMKNRRVCEPEYASFATETFLRRQRRFIKTPTDRKWRAERMIQLFAPPTEETEQGGWVAPPSFEQSPDFQFDVRPDCSYWLSLAGFNSEYRGELGSAVYVHDDDWITCPYFTIEFKKHGQSISQATWQACAAASMALYSRYLLKRKALAVGAEEWSDFDRTQMKHYILTFVGYKYDIWVMRARFSEDSSTWDGCSVMKISNSTCTSKVGVRRLESWINEIHRWGLSGHAAGCQADVKRILGHSDVDISLIDVEVPE